MEVREQVLCRLYSCTWKYIYTFKDDTYAGSPDLE